MVEKDNLTEKCLKMRTSVLFMILYQLISMNSNLFPLSQVFMPTAVKFHYIFNLRDLSNVFQGLLFASNECITTPTEITRLW